MRHFLEALQRSNVVQSANVGWQAAVQAEHLAVHQRSQREVVEQICEVSPDLNLNNGLSLLKLFYLGVAVFSQAFVVEAVHLGDLPTLVVSAQNGHSVRVSHLKQKSI